MIYTFFCILVLGTRGNGPAGPRVLARPTEMRILGPRWGLPEVFQGLMTLVDSAKGSHGDWLFRASLAWLQQKSD